MNKDYDKNILMVGAHQLRSPVASIQTQLETILVVYKGELQGKMKRLLEGASRRAADMLQLLNDLLEFGEMDYEKAKENFGALDLEELFSKVIDMLSMKAELKEIDLVVEKDSSLPVVWGYEPGLNHVFYNLIENAIKYTPEGGMVTVKIDYKDGLLKGVVKDTGIGIPEEDIDKVFLEFYRTPNAKKEAIGTGLGLPIVSKAVELHKGEIKCESKQGEGTSFKFSMTLAEVSSHEISLIETFRITQKILDLLKDKLPSDKFGILENLLNINFKKNNFLTTLLRHEFNNSEIDTVFDCINMLYKKEKKEKLKVVVIGGKTAGPKVAAKVRRMDENALVTILEKDESLSYAGCALPYYISGMISTPEAFMTTYDGDIRDVDFFRKIKDINVLNRTAATSINREKKEVLIEDLRLGIKDKIRYDKLVIATGSNAVVPPIKGIERKGVYTLHKVEDAHILRKELKENRAKDIVIIGGGLIGAETAEALTRRGARVTIVEERDQILGFLDKEMAFLVKNYFESCGIRILINQAVEEVTGSHNVEGVRINGRIIPADLVILSAGVRPEVSLAKSCGLEIGTTGGIKINEYLQTSDPHIYALGDCVENRDIITGSPVYMPLGSVATRQGRIAGINVTGGEKKFKGVLGTCIMKVFKYNIAAVGLNEKEAEMKSFAPLSVIVPGPDKDHYYPDSKFICVKLIADKNIGKVLGAQIVGRGDASKRIDVIATAISAGMKISDLSDLDLAYAPPYSSAMDIVVTAANVLNNKIEGNYTGISPLELIDRKINNAEMILLDVRTREDYDDVSIPSSIHIPLNTLRGRLHQLPKDEEIIICCRTGINSYEALRILKANGFNDVKVLDGGILTALGESIELY